MEIEKSRRDEKERPYPTAADREFSQELECPGFLPFSTQQSIITLLHPQMTGRNAFVFSQVREIAWLLHYLILVPGARGTVK